jgi:hypothetical protein
MRILTFSHSTSMGVSSAWPPGSSVSVSNSGQLFFISFLFFVPFGPFKLITLFAAFSVPNSNGTFTLADSASTLDRPWSL